MPVRSQRLLQIISEELNNIEQRGKGYRGALKDALVEIIETVKQHRIVKIKVQQRTNDIVNTAGRYLYKNRSAPKSQRGGSK